MKRSFLLLSRLFVISILFLKWFRTCALIDNSVTLSHNIDHNKLSDYSMLNRFQIQANEMKCAVGPGTTGEDVDATVTCSQNFRISSISFASFGTPTGNCGSYAQSSCHSSSSLTQITNRCMGLNSCVVSSSKDIFGDPCVGIVKHLRIQVTCIPLPSSQPTNQPTRQPSNQPSNQPSRQPSNQPTGQPSRQPSNQPTKQPSNQPSNQPTTQPSKQPTGQPSRQPSSQPTQPSGQPTGQPSRQPSIQPTEQPSIQPSNQPTQPSGQPTMQPTCQPSVNPSTQPSVYPTSHPSVQPSIYPSHTPSVQPSSHPTKQPSTQPTDRPSGQPHSKPTAQPSCQPSSQPTSIPSTQPYKQPTLQPTALPTGQPSRNPSTQSTCQPTCVPSVQPSIQPSVIPSCQSSKQPTIQPIVQPSCEPSLQPIAFPTIVPSTHPSKQPSARPSFQPTACPSNQPSIAPSQQPITRPSSHPSAQSSTSPSYQPSSDPSSRPSKQPFGRPSTQPSRQPFSPPTTHPSSQPSGQPMVSPSNQPTCDPSALPSRQPTGIPTRIPSTAPSVQPSCNPSRTPSSQPTMHPSVQPFSQPTGQPSSQPLSRPSVQPSIQPSVRPTSQPSCQPAATPSRQPSAFPSRQPSSQPSIQPTISPTRQPSRQPMSHPSSHPSNRPSSIPTELQLPLSANESRKPSRTPTIRPTQSLPLHTDVSVIYPSNAQQPVQFRIVLPYLFASRVSGDGLKNIVLSDGKHNGTNYIMFGGSSVPTSTTYLMFFENAVGYDQSGRSVSNAGDVNGDGFDDLIIGVPYAARCYVLFGTENGYRNMSNGFMIVGKDPTDLTGWSVSGAGDVNNDTYADIIIGAPDAGVTHSGVVYIIYGKSTDFFVINLAELSVEDGYAVYGAASWDRLGVSVSGVGDMDSDEYDDVIIGALRTNSLFAGTAYIIFGSVDKLRESLFLNARNNSNIFEISSEIYSWFGYSVSAAGDVNRDGFDDIIIGSMPQKLSFELPVSYLIYGSKNRTSRMSITRMTSSRGVKISGGGVTVAGIGDIDQDGYDDVMLGSNYQFNTGGGFVITYPLNLDGVQTRAPIPVPSIPPSKRPSQSPSILPTRSPSECPSLKPTRPTLAPSITPTGPTQLPTMTPTQPTSLPSAKPTAPSMIPSVIPSESPSMSPSASPSESPSTVPTVAPTVEPTMIQTLLPTSMQPSVSPSFAPIINPTRHPVARPTMLPTFVVTTVLPTIIVTGVNGYPEVTVTVNGEIERNIQNSVYIVNTTDIVHFINGYGNDTFIIIPNTRSEVWIQEFHVTDRIDLQAFPQYQLIADLNITEFRNDSAAVLHLRGSVGSVTYIVIQLDHFQKVVLHGLTRNMLQEINFIFATSSKETPVKKNILNGIMARVFAGTFCCLFVTYFGRKLHAFIRVERRLFNLDNKEITWESARDSNGTYISFTLNESFITRNSDSTDDSRDSDTESKSTNSGSGGRNANRNYIDRNVIVEYPDNNNYDEKESDPTSGTDEAASFATVHSLPPAAFNNNHHVITTNTTRTQYDDLDCIDEYEPTSSRYNAVNVDSSGGGGMFEHGNYERFVPHEHSQYGTHYSSHYGTQFATQYSDLGDVDDYESSSKLYNALNTLNVDTNVIDVGMFDNITTMFYEQEQLQMSDYIQQNYLNKHSDKASRKYHVKSSDNNSQKKKQSSFLLADVKAHTQQYEQSCVNNGDEIDEVQSDEFSLPSSFEFKSDCSEGIETNDVRRRSISPEYNGPSNATSVITEVLSLPIFNGKR